MLRHRILVPPFFLKIIDYTLRYRIYLYIIFHKIFSLQDEDSLWGTFYIRLLERTTRSHIFLFIRIFLCLITDLYHLVTFWCGFEQPHTTVQSAA